MKKSLLLIAVAAAGICANAQQLKEGYLVWPSGEQLATYIQQWNGGAGTITIDGKAWDDVAFFTSHVRPRARFTNTATQVYPNRVPYNLNATNEPSAANTDKRLANWVCISDEALNGLKTNALPNASFDQECFNMWSYVDNYGNWGSPFGWTVAAWADICHKNGVGTHGVAGIPNAGLSGNWATCLTALGNVDAATAGKFFRYFGQDGLGYNSEFSTTTATITKLRNLHDGLATYMADKNPLWEIMWYGGTGDNGSISFDTGLDNNQGLFKGASIFLNYNWNNTNTITNAIKYAKSNVKKSPLYIYAGMNLQGGEPKSGSNYDMLKDYNYSIGLWGGHSNNTIWKARQSKGSSPTTKQLTYNRDSEMWFGNGKRNPAIKQTPTLNRAHTPSENFAGMSSMMNARSTMDFTIANEPFITYFNQGNGQYFNYEGNRVNSNPWYNIGVQDFMPTWRWWFAPTWLQTDVTEGTTHLAADITWDDAYMGGSCLQISGTTTKEYLHLLKTKFTVASGQDITVRYKLLDGEADIKLVVAPASEPGVAWKTISLATVADAISLQDQSYKSGKEGWIEKTFRIAASNIRTLKEKTIGIIGLEFANAKNMRMLLGEISVKPQSSTTTPVSPTIKKAELLSYNVTGCDGKLIWNMPNSKAAGEPVYNDEVNTSLFKVYSQQEGQAEYFSGITTTWASFVFRAPIDSKGTGRVRFGVSALSMDHRTESAIAWSDWMNLPEYVVTKDVAINKNVIKPGEEFTMNFVDPQMANATWVVKNSSGTEVWSGTGTTVTCSGLEDVGSYDLEVTYDDGSRAATTVTYPSFINISSWSVGALPQINSLSINGAAVDENSADIEIGLNQTTDQTKKFSYTGRYADGNASRGINLDECWFGVNQQQLGIDAGQSFSVAAWVRLDELPDVCNLLTIDNYFGSWPFNRWGFFWSRVTPDGTFNNDLMDGGFASRCNGTDTEGNRTWYTYHNTKINVGAWTHVAIVFDYNGSSMRMHLYVNGVRQQISQYLFANKGSVEKPLGGERGKWSDLSLAKNVSGVSYGENVAETPYFNHPYNLSSGDWISFGGSAPNISAMKGALDDFQVWGKAMTDAEVKQSMEGLDKKHLPADVLGFWDFESDCTGTNNDFAGAAGSNATYTYPKAQLWKIDKVADEYSGEEREVRVYPEPRMSAGCPFVGGESYPVVTKPTWKTRGTQANAEGTGEAGSSDISFNRLGDYNVELTLENGHGKDTKSYPVIHVLANVAGIEGIGADGNDVKTYTVDGTLFLDFAEAGSYNVEVYSIAGMLSAQKQLDAVSGQTATIKLGTKGVYLVKVVKDGRVLRTVKVVNK